MGTVIQLRAGAVPANAMVSIDCPMAGRLVGVEWAMDVAASGADFAVLIQAGFGSVINEGNDSRNVISNSTLATDLTTSGAAKTFTNHYSQLPDIPVGMGERIFLHGAGTAITINVRCALHFDFELDKASVRRR